MREILSKIKQVIDPLMSPAKGNEQQKIGVILPTYNRPDLLRGCMLQLLAQTRRPDLVCVHQNGTADSYIWCVRDLNTPTAWMHTPAKIPQNSWYRIPLDHLIRENCTHFLWIDHDDMYLSNHIETCMAELAQGYDFRISAHCGILILRKGKYEYVPDALFDTIHAPGGMNSSMAFTREFALALSEDLKRNEFIAKFADEVVATDTMPRFKCFRSAAKTTIYTSHSLSLSSSHWLESETHFNRFPV